MSKQTDTRPHFYEMNPTDSDSLLARTPDGCEWLNDRPKSGVLFVAEGPSREVCEFIAEMKRTYKPYSSADVSCICGDCAGTK